MARRSSNSSRGYRKVTYPAALRMAKLVDEMPRHGIGRRLTSVAEGLGVDGQTVRRYVRAMAGEFVTGEGEPQFVIEKKGGEEWLIRRQEEADSSGATIYHLISVYLSLEYFRMLGKNVVALSVEEVLEKIEKLLPAKHRQLLNDLPRKFYTAPWAPKDYSDHLDILEDATTAVVYQNVVKMIYKPTGGEPHELTVRPLTLLYHKGGIYLIGIVSTKRRPVYFNIERIQAMEITPEKFEYPRRYHPEQMLDGAFGIFSGPAKLFNLKFSPAVAEYVIARKWHKSQKIETQADGSVILSLKVADSEEVWSWIRSFGQEIKVLKP